MQPVSIAFCLIPIFIGLAWIYTSPWENSRLGKLRKTLIRITLFVAMFGGILMQEDYLGNYAPPVQRNFDLGLRFLLEAIPMLFIMFYRYFKNPERFNRSRMSGK